MPLRKIFQNLKALDIQAMDISLAVVKEYKQNRESRYVINYVQINERLAKRLGAIVRRKIEFSNTFEEYTFDCPEPEADQVRTINYEATDFFRIYEQLEELNPEEDIIDDIDELVRAKAYLIILRDMAGIKVIGFKTVPENWKMRKDKGLIPLLFRENRFEDLEDENVFSISSTIDLMYFDETLFILSKREFEAGLNFRDGMLSKAEEMYNEVEEMQLFINMDLLKNKVGNNQRYLRKIATIKNLGYYRDPVYLRKLEEICGIRNWNNIEFLKGQIVLTEANLDDVLTLLQNKRLHSEVTDEIFDVDSAKKYLKI